MGVTINQKLGQTKQRVKDTLDIAEKYTEIIKKNVVDGLEIKTRRLSDFELLIDVTGCETLSFNFKSVKEINEQARSDYAGYDYAVLTNNGERKLDEGYEIKEYPQNEKYYSAGFTKTQFASNIIAHKIIADLIKVVASRCFYAEVNDEGDYYHTGDLGDAIRNIRENSALIDGLTSKLTESGWKDTQIIKGSTKIGK